jgi:hypothetical protein
MRNRAFSLQACNEIGAACDNHRWSCCKSFHGKRRAGTSGALRFNADDNRASH